MKQANLVDRIALCICGFYHYLCNACFVFVSRLIVIHLRLRVKTQLIFTLGNGAISSTSIVLEFTHLPLSDRIEVGCIVFFEECIEVVIIAGLVHIYCLPPGEPSEAAIGIHKYIIVAVFEEVQYSYEPAINGLPHFDAVVIRDRIKSLSSGENTILRTVICVPVWCICDHLLYCRFPTLPLRPPVTNIESVLLAAAEPNFIYIPNIS